MCLGTTDLPLGAAGYQQAKKMASLLPPVTAVFSSPLQRAVQTAQTIQLPVTVLPGLQELYMGAWDGLTFREIRQAYPELYAARGTDPGLLPPGAERWETGIARFRSAMAEAARISHGDFAVVSHAGIISQFLGSLGDANRKPDYAQIIPLLCQDGEFRIWEDKQHA